MRALTSRPCAALALALAVTFAAPARAGESAEACAARISARVDQAMRAAERATALAAEQSRPGLVVTPRAFYYVDGPVVPIDRLQWAELAGTRPTRRPTTTDTLLRVGPGVTLALSNVGGDIRVRTWNRNEVRVVAEHDRDDRIVADLSGPQLRLGARPRGGLPARVEWDLTVPQWLPLELSGMEGDISISGLRASVQAQTVRGDINVDGCQGPMMVNSIEGEVHVNDVDGNVSAGSVNNIIRLVRVTGPVEAQTINGDIQLEKLMSPNVDASTVNGRVYYASTYQPRGRYAFASHNGHIYVTVPQDEQNVNVTVQSFNGQVETPSPVPAPLPRLRGRPMRFTLGDMPTPAAPRAPRVPRAPASGRAWRAEATPAAAPTPELEVESFGGSIQFVTEAEMVRALRLQRATLDSLRVQLRQLKLKKLARRGGANEAPPAPGER